VLFQQNISVFFRQVAPVPACWLFKTSATSWPLSDLLTLKVMSQSRVTWATSVPILVFLGLSVLKLGPMYATDRQTSDRQMLDVRQKHRLMPPPYGQIINCPVWVCMLHWCYFKFVMMNRCVVWFMLLYMLWIKDMTNVLNNYGAGEMPRPYIPTGASGVASVTCKVCRAMINLEGKASQLVVKCISCNEATVSVLSLWSVL